MVTDDCRHPADRPAARAKGNYEPKCGAPLDGVVVLDLSRVLAGPYAAMVLGDLGARVIKVERPGSGDDTRRWGPPFVGAGDHAESTYFLAANRNKESITLDLKDPEDRIVLERFICAADVLVENFRPGVMARLGLGADHLHRLNPNLIALSISGFGPDGPERDRPGYDQILQAEGGLMSVTGADANTPTKVGVPVADLLAGLYGVVAVLAALQERGRSGFGQAVHTSLLAGQIGIHAFQGTRYLIANEVPQPTGNDHPTVCPYGVFQTTDSPVVIAVGNDTIWQRFSPLVGIDPSDARFGSNAARLKRRGQLQQLIQRSLRTRTSQYWLDAFGRCGVPAGVVKTLDRVYATEQVLSQGLVCEVEHATLGPIRLPGSPMRFARSIDRQHIAPPTLGQHSAMLREEFAPEQIPPGTR